jgi:hypothetical protein
VLFEQTLVEILQFLFLTLKKNFSFYFRTNVGERLLSGENFFRDENEMQAKGRFHGPNPLAGSAFLRELAKSSPKERAVSKSGVSGCSEGSMVASP